MSDDSDMPPPLQAEWFARIDGQNQGPLDTAQIADLVQENKITKHTLVWKKGMAEWQLANSVEALSQVFVAGVPTFDEPPPLPPDANNRVQDDETPAIPQSADDPELLIRKPAIGMLIGGIILIISNLLGLALVLLAFKQNHPSGGTIFLLFLFFFLMSGAVIFGSAAMLKQSSYRLSMTGSICGIVGGVVNYPLGWLLVLPFGIWALAILRRNRENRKLGAKVFPKKIIGETGMLVIGVIFITIGVAIGLWVHLHSPEQGLLGVEHSLDVPVYYVAMVVAFLFVLTGIINIVDSYKKHA